MNKISLQKGFTLVEMVIALAIFTVVALVAIGALLKVTDANRKSITLKTTINNLNFALESMSREMRVGKNYRCEGLTDCAITNMSTSWTITFESSNLNTAKSCNLKFTYKYENETLLKSEQNPSGDCNDTPLAVPLISSNIKITDTVVKVTNTNTQPKVFLWLKGYSGEREREKTEFSIQTSISQRLIKTTP